MNIVCDIHAACTTCGECHICNDKICFFLVQEEIRKLFNAAIEEHDFVLAHEIEQLANKLDLNLTGE